ncbi:PadR family transcriptional regulator [Corynebacterium aquatimens]|uniref:DNA-binding PadR family transcriptional regulator n=1 Tax=Corynebacterium aquatimens TaxID=1190508 RepID=A0A931E239_9CORY|nr:PadR family transcriptional regulator [Corynebacterium aquatimens]MBG6121113.1 DNA-binding PadR family transcriptional regulator [Corynebacterium aquatimens]WJY66331.1 Transcriptional regulator PadR-like family protein [Corynebacterium aquatimens]
MSVRNSLLALLHHQPSTPAELQHGFHETMSGRWNLNMGQVTQTLARCERDGLIAATGTTPTHTGHEATTYQLTKAGLEEVDAWWSTPVTRPAAERDEVVMKIVLGLKRDDIDIIVLMDTQRRFVLEQIREANKEMRSLNPVPTADRLMCERRILDLEADIRFLDRVEALLNNAANSNSAPRKSSNSRKEG